MTLCVEVERRMDDEKEDLRGGKSKKKKERKLARTEVWTRTEGGLKRKIESSWTREPSIDFTLSDHTRKV